MIMPSVDTFHENLELTVGGRGSFARRVDQAEGYKNTRSLNLNSQKSQPKINLYVWNDGNHPLLRLIP